MSKTAVLTLRARVDEHHRPDRVFADPRAVEWWSRVDWPTELDDWYDPRAQNALALRADDIDRILAGYVSGAEAPLTVVELGCGLSTRRLRLRDLPVAGWVDLDLPPVAELRRAWGVQAQQIASSVLDLDWMDGLEGPPDRFVFVAEGLLYYLRRAEVDGLIASLGERFSGSALLMDVVGANDFTALADRAARVGTPVAWKLTRPYDEVLDDFGLDLVPGFEPDRLLAEMYQRNWDRFDKKLRGAIYFVMSSEPLRGGRSGNILGRLKA